MKRVTRLIQGERQQETAAQAQTTGSVRLEFAIAEEAIRQDREALSVPPGVAERLEASIAADRKPPRPWWKRLLGLDG